MIEIWNQANTYAKFILILGIAYPAAMMHLGYRIEKLFPDEEKTPLVATK